MVKPVEAEVEAEELDRLVVVHCLVVVVAETADLVASKNSCLFFIKLMIRLTQL